MPFVLSGSLSVLFACSDPSEPTPEPELGWSQLPSLPEPVANNAVTAASLEGGCMVFSLLGIDASRSDEGIHRRGYRWRTGDESWISLPEIPGPPRLASNAVTLGGEPYLLGGYEVRDGGGEVSSDLLVRFNLGTGQWEELASIPVPIDDAGVVAFQDRYIVVVSGWSNTGNRSEVQIYDREANAWSLATAFPGTPVFGQSAAILGNQVLVIDGVSSSALRGFEIVNQAWLGTIDENDPTQIEWQDLGSHPGPPRYRAAGGSWDGEMWFAGGTDTPYNYDGLRYDNGQAASPLSTSLVFSEGSFREDTQARATNTMDHRALAECDNQLLSVGGMKAGPEVSDEVWALTLPLP